MNKFTLHIVALPHTSTNSDHSACAFTMKVLHLCQMMETLGYQIYHYGNEGSEVPCEHINIFTQKEQENFFGKYNQNQLYNVDWSGKAEYWNLFNSRAASEIHKRKNKKDFICLICGTNNIPLVQQLLNPQEVLVCETGIGYNGTFAKYRVFESYAHMHKIWGVEGGYDPDGKFYDAVIPNYLNPNDYPFKEEKQDYFLYLGRLIKRKGINIAIETCKRINARLIVAGQGAVDFKNHTLMCEDGEKYQYEKLEYVGFATGQKRADLFSNAKAVFVPSIYIEPFGAVAIEAQMAGTPVITTDWGAFPETVEQGKTGFRCRTLKQFVEASNNIDSLNKEYIHQRAVNNYSMNSVKYKYQDYFETLNGLWRGGWYE